LLDHVPDARRECHALRVGADDEGVKAGPKRPCRRAIIPVLAVPAVAKMDDATEELRARLARAGWAITDLREKVVEVEGELLDVTVGAACRGPLRARFVRLGHCVDGDLIDRLFVSHTAARRIGATKLRAAVLDTGRALDELTELAPLLAAPDFAAALALVEARGFSVDRQASVEDTHDSESWTIRAQSAGEQLDLHLRFGGHGLPERGPDAFVNTFNQAELRGPSTVLTVALHSLAMAEVLLDELAPARVP
jgi:hypothetical protein